MKRQKIQLVALLAALILLAAGYVAAGRVSAPDTESENANKTMSEITEAVQE